MTKLNITNKILSSSYTVGSHVIQNRLAIHPMEGRDSTDDGSPGELAVRRYKRLAEGGAGLIWYEAVAISRDCRGSVRQQYIHEGNIGAFSELLTQMREIALRETGVQPVIILQATHNGRYTKKDGVPSPVIARNNPIFEADSPLGSEKIITDDELKHWEERFAEVAKLAQLAGFDGIDIKACHGYLISELLASFTRPGIYGGSFENRTRFLRNCFDAVRAVSPKDFIVTTRLNIYDGYPYPYGFGMEKNGNVDADLTEPIALLKELNLEIVNITMGNPYYNSYVNRPVDDDGVERQRRLTKQVKEAIPDTAVVATGLSFLREKAPGTAAEYVENGVGTAIGFGRLAFAYPLFARDILEGKFDAKKVCTACGLCSVLMRSGQSPGCVVRDEVYKKIYKETIQK